MLEKSIFDYAVLTYYWHEDCTIRDMRVAIATEYSAKLIDRDYRVWSPVEEVS